MDVSHAVGVTLHYSPSLSTFSKRAADMKIILPIQHSGEADIDLISDHSLLEEPLCFKPESRTGSTRILKLLHHFSISSPSNEIFMAAFKSSITCMTSNHKDARHISQHISALCGITCPTNKYISFHHCCFVSAVLHGTKRR